MHASYLAQSPIPQIFPHFFYYQDVPRLQLAKCTYAGLRANCRRKSRSDLSLKLSENNPTCALRMRSRDGMRAIVTSLKGLETGQKSTERGSFRRVLAGFRAGPGRSAARRAAGAKPVVPRARRHRTSARWGRSQSVQRRCSQDPERWRSESSLSRPAPTVPTAADGRDPTDIARPTVGRRASGDGPAGGQAARTRRAGRSVRAGQGLFSAASLGGSTGLSGPEHGCQSPPVCSGFGCSRRSLRSLSRCFMSSMTRRHSRPT